MLKDDLYIIQDSAEDNNVVEATVELNTANKIFEGHFPGQPVLPGACMLQMCRELMEVFTKQQLCLIKADDIRFSAMVNPNESNVLKFQLPYKNVDEQTISINGKIIKQDESICCKVKATYKLLP